MMRARTMMSALLALTLVAGLVTVPPAFAEDPPIVGELPGEDGDGEDDETGDGSGEGGSEGEGGGEGDGDAAGGPDDAGTGGFGPMAFGEPVPMTMTPIPLPERLERSFDFDEPSALFAGQDFPLPDQDTLDDWAERGVTPQQRPMEVHSVVAADLNGDGRQDLVSLVNIRWPDTGISFRAPGRAFAQDLSVPEEDPGLGGWYVVVHLNSEVGILGGMAYLVTEADSSFIGAIAVGDVTATDDRAALDIVYTNHQSGEVRTLVNDGDGAFGTAIGTAIMSKLDRGITLGYIDDDDLLDFVASSTDNSTGTIIVASGDGAGGFIPEAQFAFASPANIALIDADGSGRPEILTTSFDTGTSTALWRWTQPGEADTGTSNGWGIATDAGDLSSTQAAAAWVGDFDGDADQDVALLLRDCFDDRAPHCLLPLLGDGAGRFEASSAVAVPHVSSYGNRFSSISFPKVDGRTTDINGDNRPDILLPGGAGEVAVLLADGSGGFRDVQVFAGTGGWEPALANGWDNTEDEYASASWPGQWGTSYRANAVAAADVTGDGLLDLIVGTGAGTSSLGSAPGQLAVVAGVGGGSFAAATAQAVSDTWRQPEFRRDWITTARWNDDTYDDLVFFTGDDVMVALGKQGGFERETRVGAAPDECVARYDSRMLVADVNGDGSPDLVCGGSTAFYVMDGTASGQLGDATQLGMLTEADAHAEGTHLLALADVDGDERLDLVFSTSVATDQGTYYGLTDIAFGWLKKLDSGGFDRPELLITSTNYQGGTVHRTDSNIPFRPAVADFNGDGRADFALAARIQVDESGSEHDRWGRYDLLTFLSDDDLAYVETAQDVYLELWNSHLGLLDTAYLNGDHKPDLILTGLEYASGEFKSARRLLLGNGDGTFTAGQRLPTGAGWPGARVADLNGDGNVDLVSPTGYRGVELRAGNGDGTFGVPELFGTPGVALGWVELVDADGDGLLDLIGSIRETVGSTHSDSLADPDQIAIMINRGEAVDTGDPPCEPDDEDCDPACDPGDEDCDDDDGDPPAAKTVNLVADAPEWSGAASLDAITAGTVTVTVRNTGTAATTGTWVDSLWLSADDTWSTDDTLLKAIPRTSAIAAGGTVEIGIPVTLAPPAAGTFHLFVRADTRGEITETRLDDDDVQVPAEDDNLGVSAEVVFTPPTLDVPANGATAPGTETTVTGPGAVIRIPEIATGTAAVRLTVTGASVAGFAVRAGKLPSDTAADQRVTGAGGLTLLPGAERYLRLDLGEGQTATVRATRLEFGIGSVAPKRVSVGGTVSFVLTGIGLAQVSAAWAIGPEGDEIAATGLTSSSAGLTVTFDLTGQKPGSYDLRVQSTSASATLSAAFTAVANRVGSVRTSVLIPSSLRSGTVGEVWITYANDGLTDAVAPILRVSSRGAAPVDGSPYPMGVVYVSPQVAWAPVGVVPAGASGRIVIPFRVDASGPDGLPDLPPDGNQYTFYVEEFGIDSVAPYNAAADFAEELPEIADDGGRTAIALELTARLGETGGSYLAAMHRLRATLDPPTADMDELREKIFENVKAAILTDAVHGTVRDADSALLTNRGLRFEVPGVDDEPARTVEALSDETGNWSAPGIDGASTVDVFVDGYGPTPVTTWATPSASSAVDVTLPAWSPLSGTVTGLDGRFAPDAVVTVQSSDGTRWVRGVTDADGVYRFDGIAPGTHRLVAAGMDGGLVITDLTMGAAPAAKNLTLQATDLAADGGRVTGALPPMPITGLPADQDIPAEVSVWVDDGAGLRPVETEIDGSFAVVGTPGTSATLRIFDAFYGVRSATVTFPAAGATVGMEWAPGGSTVSIPVTLTADDQLPPVYLQPAATADRVPIPGADAGLLLIPTGLTGDPVTWTGGLSAGDEGTLSLANVPPGDYRVTVMDGDGEDVAEFSVAASDVTVEFGVRPVTVTAAGTAMRGGATIDGGFVELVSTNLTPARRYAAMTGDAAVDPSTTPGAWSVAVAAGTYDVAYYDASGAFVATEVKTYTAGSPFRGAGRAFASAPAAAPTALGSSYTALPALRIEGEYGPAGGSVADLKETYKAKFDVKTVPETDPMVAQAQAMPYPKQPPPDQCKMLDYSWLDAAKVAANRAEATRKLIWELLSDTAKTRNWMLGEAALRAIMFLGEISNLVLGVIAVKQAVGKAAATAAAREEAKALAAQGIKPPAPSGIIDLNWQPVLENIQKISALSSTIYTNAKAAITSAEPASTGTVMGMLGEIGNLALDLTKEIGIMATSAAVGLARDVIGPIAAINNMITQVREAGESYRSAIAQLDNMKAALDQLYVSYDFDLGQAHQAWFDFQANRFPEIELDGEGCEGGGDGDDDEEPGGPGDDDDPDDPGDPDDPPGPKGPKKPTGPKPGPKQPVGPAGGREVSGTDPNEIVGPSGVGDERWLQPGGTLGYRIGFENLGPGTVHPPDGVPLASGPAALVTVSFPLPADALIDTVELGDFGFGVGDGEVRHVPGVGGTSFEDTAPVSMTVPSVFDGELDVTLSLSRKARAWIDRATRTVHWEISLVDAATGLTHSNPAAGFLPPEPGGDDAGAGQGWTTVSFATDASATGPIEAQASIVFDTNDAIETNIWTNKLDGTAPTASVSAAATTVVGQTVTVGLNDAGGSGAGRVDIYRSVDGGPWLPWLYQVMPGAKVLLGAVGQNVQLQARAVDRVGNAGGLGAIAATRLVATPSGGPGSGDGGSSGSAGGADIDTLPDNAERIAGSNRYGTAAEIAALFGTADSVIVANGEDYKQGFDALAANYLAGRADSPIVLTRAGVLPAESLAAICSVLRGSTAATRTIYILGAADTVSAAVAAQLQRPCSPALGNVKVVRIGGSDRYETAALIATRDAGSGGDVRATSVAGPRTVFLASGVVNADALAAGAVSARFGIPVLLTGPNRLPEATIAALKTLKAERVVVLGGVDRVSAAVKAQLGALGVGEVMTIAGKDRFETSALIAAWAYLPLARGGLGHTGSLIGLANGMTGFADALAGGPLLGRKGGMLLLTAPAALPESLRRFLAGLPERSLLALGGPTTVADSVIAAGARAAG